jgi:hypothetical protein
MRFTIHSGTEIHARAVAAESAESALDFVLDLIAARRPNIVVVDDAGGVVSAGALWRLAAAEARRDVRQWPARHSRLLERRGAQIAHWLSH